MSLFIRFKTAWSLGVGNVLRVLCYRLGLRFGLHPVRSLRAELPEGPFFSVCTLPPMPAQGSKGWWEAAQYFGAHHVVCGAQPPDWHANPLAGTVVADPDRPWWTISAFDPALGDIKTVWEASRLDWLLAFAQRYRHGDLAALQRLNAWLDDWCRRNPAYRGPNWMCGQEASIRVLRLAVAALILGQEHSPSTSLRSLVRAHLVRIAPTLQYAVAQDNNHGTSEAAALFVGGSWLASLEEDKQAQRWAALGRRWLENRVARLVAEDGSLSQHSSTYHRVVLDTLSMVEVWRRQLNLPAFSDGYEQRCVAATHWLRAIVRPDNGDAPNLGANDGALFLPLGDTKYRDFRPSVQLAATLFTHRSAYAGEGAWNVPLRWLGLEVPGESLAEPRSRKLDDGGYFVLHRGAAMALLRYPRFRFRPSHADALHVDLWVGGENLLRDGGSYSYADLGGEFDGYFSGTAAHNTVQFDGRDQMPRISRFLFGSWLKTSGCSALEESGESLSSQAAYRDGEGAEHRREVTLSKQQLRVVDRIGGHWTTAVLRWRLRPGEWQLDSGSVRLGQEVLAVESTSPVVRMELVEGWESRHYLEKTRIPVLEVEVTEPTVLISEYRWA